MCNFFAVTAEILALANSDYEKILRKRCNAIECDPVRFSILVTGLKRRGLSDPARRRGSGQQRNSSAKTET
jgi:hypothetical protein